MKKRQALQKNDRIHDLEILRFHHKDQRGRKFFFCKCICGNTKIIQGSLITSGNTKSCGCRVQRAANLRRLPNNGGVINQIILGYKRHAERRGFKWELNYSDVVDIIKKPCFYCGQKKSNIKVTKNCKDGFKYNGIDRTDSTFGYIKNNCVPCCNICNKAKMAMTKTVFLEWIKKVYDHSIKKSDGRSMGRITNKYSRPEKLGG